MPNNISKVSAYKFSDFICNFRRMRKKRRRKDFEIKEKEWINLNNARYMSMKARLRLDGDSHYIVSLIDLSGRKPSTFKYNLRNSFPVRRYPKDIGVIRSEISGKQNYVRVWHGCRVA